ncbi:V-type proton ATPase subunit d, partial [Diplonema papillatum]
TTSKWKHGPSLWTAFTGWLKALKWASPGQETGISYMELAVAFELETGCKLPPVKNRFYAPPPEVPRNKPTTARDTLPDEEAEDGIAVYFDGAIYDTMTILELPIMKFFQHEQERVEFESDQSSMEYVHAMFKKAYLEQFYDLCQEIGGETWTVMKDILEFEADRTVIGLTRNCFGNKDIRPGLERSRLFPNFGTLVDWHARIADCDDDEALRAVLGDEKAGLHHWRNLISGSSGGLGENTSVASAMETRFIEKSIELNRTSMANSFHYGVFYSWLKLREQELSNLFWICACIEMKTRDRIREFSEIFPSN